MTVGVLAVGASITAVAGTAEAAEPTGVGKSSPSATASWRVDLSRLTAMQHNTRRTSRGLTLADSQPRGDHNPPTAATLAPGQPDTARGSYTAPEVNAGQWVSAVVAKPDASVPAGTRVEVDVRGRGVDGGWTEWRTTKPDSILSLPEPVSKLQARVILTSAADGAAPVVSGLELQSAAAPAESATAAATAYGPVRLFATREGLVGHTTANGHVIKSRDHFVALPSRRMLASNGGNEYRVKVCYKGRCETAPVWDVGPWNTRDDYWNPSSVRETFRDLPQGRPEAQAAYQNGYNNGKDEFGRTVANPAGIDLADGTFWDGLAMTNNDWVDVTFNPGSSGGTVTVTAWAQANVRSCATTTCAVVSQVYANQTYPAVCWTVGEKVTAEGVTNDKWVKLPLVAGGYGYVSGIYLTGDQTGGVTTRCT
ncbi:SH3 domain-containing protein [Micromonospora sp. NPDC005305]|uniref:SH3 domain-containing protein n=1 Tax=Micromonospora sp. NPDC005305 TaxID=3156875 RepID=UPI0033B44361